MFTTLKAKKKKNKENFLVLSQRFWMLRSQLYHIFILLCSNQIRLLRTLLTKLQNTRKILHDSSSNNMMHHLFLLFAVKGSHDHTSLMMLIVNITSTCLKEKLELFSVLLELLCVNKDVRKPKTAVLCVQCCVCLLILISCSPFTFL